MANLVSPGVDVTITDESQYLPAPTNSVPFILLATAQNKANASQTGIAPGTTSANAGRLFQVTSQRDLVSLFGNPFFYSNNSGTSINGFELNEYGLLAAYSALGISNRVFCLRADVDLASLVGQTGRPVGEPDNGDYWLDTTTSEWGINVFNAITGQFNTVTPIVITDEELLVNGTPRQSVGIPGNYAIVAIPTYDFPSLESSAQFFFKNESNNWVAIGSPEWLGSWPTVQGTATPATLTVGNTIDILINGVSGISYTVPAAPNNTITFLVNTINSRGFKFLFARENNGRLELFSRQNASSLGDATPFSLVLSGTGLSELGITSGVYYQPGVFFGTSSQRPLWQAGQSFARPTGSVWFRIGGAGLNTVISQWDSVTNTWVLKPVVYASSDVEAINQLDSAGGRNIPEGTIYTQFDFNRSQEARNDSSPLYYWRRLSTGPTVVTGTVSNPVFSNGPYVIQVSVSVPGAGTTTRTLQVADEATAQDFVNSWNSAAIPFTIARVTNAGTIELTHTEGGVIIINDFGPNGFSTGLLSAAGFDFTTLGVKEGPSHSATFNNLIPTTTSGSGNGLTISVETAYQKYFVRGNNILSQGTDYAVGDTVTFPGTSMGGTAPANNLVVVVTSVNGVGGVQGIQIVSGEAAPMYTAVLSNWVEFDMVANEGAPVQAPANNTNWFYSVVDQVDILVNTSTGWRGYGNVAYDNNGFPLPSGVNATDPNGPIVSSSAPVQQSDGTSLEFGDIWIDTSDLENYPIVNRWQQIDGQSQWVRLDNSDQTSSSGIAFADVRWADSGNVDPSNDPVPSIRTLLTSDYIDVDAPSSSLFPVGMLAFNTRRSGFNVKQFRRNYFNSATFPDESLPLKRDTWVSVSGLKADGSPNMGRKAQRAMVVQAMRAAIDSNTNLRDEDNFFNILAAPGYPELQPNLIALNNDRDQTGFIIGDTPMRLRDNATAIQEWATNARGASSTGEDGLVSRDPFMGLFYPSGVTNDLSGNQVVVPASHMMIRTFLRNDNVSFPWFAPAGTRRGLIDNASAIGFLDSNGEFQSIRTSTGTRDVLYTNQINPLVFFTGNGLLNYGNKSSSDVQSSLDRINVARLVAYLRRQLTIAARPFIFEPNDALTRQEISSVIQSLMIDLVAKRGIFDYIVVCDESNNTPARIDRNELWVDIAVEPAKAVEFIYIPVRLFNTGQISGN
jgi:hypothetical protein